MAPGKRSGPSSPAGSAAPSGHIPFTPRAKKTLELSLREALSLHHNYIGTEHILLGVIREGEGVGAQVLRQHADLAAIRMAVLDAAARRKVRGRAGPPLAAAAPRPRATPSRPASRPGRRSCAPRRPLTPA